MKKLIPLLFCLLLLHSYGKAQVTVYCKSPTSISGSITPFTWADSASGWGTKKLNIPANSIEDTLMLVDDGQIADSLGCSPLVNNLEGKIALIYRGTCEFGVKAKNAQDAGAVGVIIINNIEGAPIKMGAASQGKNVTIPTVQITKEAGKALRVALDAGQKVVVFIGNKFGIYNNDLGLYAVDALVSKASAYPALLTTSSSEFNIPMGGWIHNYGINTQTGATLTAVVSGAGTYSATSNPAPAISKGDSVFVTIPTYSAPSYKGFYNISYTVNYSSADDFVGDNKFNSNVLIDSIFSYSWIDPSTKMPVSLDHNRLGTPAPPFQSCVHFRDAHASRILAKGIYSSAAHGNTKSLIDGEAVDARVYEWNDVFTGVSDAAFPKDTGKWNLKEVGRGTYSYGSGKERKMIYIPFSSPIPLIDNKRYLFCNLTFNDSINLGFSNYYDYTEAVKGTGGNDQPISVIIRKDNKDNLGVGFGNDYVPSVSVLFGVNNLGINEQSKSFDVIPYPNPSSDFIKIPLKGYNGTAQLRIMDLKGTVVNTQTVKVASQDLTVNVTGLTTGNYIFNMLFEDGRNTTFKVVITK
jgi:hypothetical protein